MSGDSERLHCGEVGGTEVRVCRQPSPHRWSGRPSGGRLRAHGVVVAVRGLDARVAEERLARALAAAAAAEGAALEGKGAVCGGSGFAAGAACGAAAAPVTQRGRRSAHAHAGEAAHAREAVLLCEVRTR